jgi:mannose-6-phosphate isomerase-like protein (cupin superfamily)
MVMQMRDATEIHRTPMSFGSAVHLSESNPREGDEMSDFTIKRTEEMETIFDGIVHRARASLGATALGLQVMNFPAGWEGYPNHDHVSDSADQNDLGQEEIYIALDGSATLLVDGTEHALEPGVLVRVGPGQKRRILPGPDGFRMVAVGGRPGEAYRPPAWTELGGPLPTPPQP